MSFPQLITQQLRSICFSDSREPNDTLATKEEIKALLDATAVRIRKGLADRRARMRPTS